MAVIKKQIILPQHSDALYAPELYALLVQSLENKEPLEIDASQVEKVSSVVVQLMVSAVKSYDRIGEQLVFISPSDPFKESCDLILGDHRNLIKHKGEVS